MSATDHRKVYPMNDPKPGSPEAVEKGCRCPVMDNHHGMGWDGGGNVFVVNAHCPLHGRKGDDNGLATD